MFWRPGRGEQSGQWHGPAKVIIQESQHVVWISHSIRVYRVAAENVRSLSEREATQSHLRKMSAEDMKISSGIGVFQYEDLTENVHQHPPPPPDPEIVIVQNPPIPNPPTSQASFQPDSEPCNMPEDNPPQSPSNAYTPATQLSNAQSDHPIPTEEVTDPKDIPVPTDDGDEFVTEDCWLVQKGKLIRIHHKPRWEAFDPSTCHDCPVDILSVSGERMSTGNAASHGMWYHHDTWGEENSTWQTQQPWTGVPMFSIIDLEPKHSETSDVLHVENHQRLSCKIFFTATVREPCNLPVPIASAAKRQRAEVKIKDLNPDELIQFQGAKEKELDQWLATDTVKKILRSQIPEQNILRARWVLTWKESEAEGCSRKAKARLVIMKILT